MKRGLFGYGAGWLFWRAVAISIELHLAQDSPLKVTQDKPFVFGTLGPPKADPAKPTISVERHSEVSGVNTDTKMDAGDVIKREVTVFSSVRHGTGTVVTGWNGTGAVARSSIFHFELPEHRAGQGKSYESKPKPAKHSPASAASAPSLSDEMIE